MEVLFALAALAGLVVSTRLLWRLAAGEDARRAHLARMHHLSLAAQVEVARAQASAAVAPAHYAPHINYSPHISARAAELPQVEAGAGCSSAPGELPSLVDLADKLDQCPRTHLLYGVLPGGELLTLPMAAGFHSLAHGDTRTGKTNWIDGLLVQLHQKAAHFPVRILAGDFKRELAATWQRSRLIDGIETEPQAIAEIIEELVNGKDGILERYDRFGALADERGAIIRNLGDYRRTTGDTLGVTFLVVDELNAVLEAAGPKSSLGSSLKQALQTGAGAGVYILGGAQYLTAHLFGRDGSKQFVTRAHFGREDGHALRMMFGQPINDQARELLTGQPGRGLIRTVQQRQATPFQALRCTDDDILTVLPLTNDTARAGPPAAPNEAPRTASAPRAPGCGDALFSADFVDQVRRCKAQGMSKTVTIELLTGVKRGGGSERYKVASAAYDRAIKGEGVQGGQVQG